MRQLRRVNILTKSDFRCAHCVCSLHFEEHPQCTVDHVVPKSKGGSDCLSNSVALCLKCNLEKGDRLVDIQSFYPYLLSEYKRKLMTYVNQIRFVIKES